MKNLTINRQDDVIMIEGELSQDTVMLGLEKILPLLSSHRIMTVNLAKITTCDSASLAFLTALLREGLKTQTQIIFINLPKQMEQLAKVSCLDSILGHRV